MTTLEKDVVGLKFGSDLVIDAQSGEINHEALGTYAAQVALLSEVFCPVIFTSGGVAAGKAFVERSGLIVPDLDSQNYAAIGSDEISRAWKGALLSQNILGAQVLANHYQMYKGSVLMQTMVRGIGKNIVYIVNENDQENLFELRQYDSENKTFNSLPKERAKKPGVDNDSLASRGMVAFKKELEDEGITDIDVHLVLFTLIGGFNIDGSTQRSIYAHNAQYYYDHCGYKSELGTGGMRYKIKAGFRAARAGVKTCIASPEADFLSVLRGIDSNGNPLGTRVLQ